MTFISTIDANEAVGDVKVMYQQLQGDRDYLPNYARAFCYRPELMQAWSHLQKAIQQTMDRRRYELITLATAQSINNSYCSLAHGQVLSEKYYTEDQVRAIAADADNNPLEAAERAMLVFVRKVASDASCITREDVDALKNQGFDDTEIFDIVTAAAARCFFAKIGDALGVRPDSAFQAMERSLRQQLTVGREIDEEVQ